MWLLWNSTFGSYFNYIISLSSNSFILCSCCIQLFHIHSLCLPILPYFNHILSFLKFFPYSFTLSSYSSLFQSYSFFNSFPSLTFFLTLFIVFIFFPISLNFLHIPSFFVNIRFRSKILLTVILNSLHSKDVQLQQLVPQA